MAETYLQTARRERSSNMELLRIVTMFFVLVVHTTFHQFGYPRANLVQADPLSWTLLSTVHASAIGCVDIFILISGWFGIRATLQGGLRLLFQLFFLVSVANIGVSLITGGCAETWGEIGKSYISYWFINSYILLYIISPVLNAYVAQASERDFRHLLIVFFIVHTLMEEFSDDIRWGYSVISFVGLYLLARYLRLYLAPRIAHWRRRVFLMGYLAYIALFVILVMSAAYIVPQHTKGIAYYMSSYANPFVIIGSVSLLLYFSRLRIQNRLINWLAAGSLAAYLLHQNRFIRPYFREMITYLSSEYRYLTFGMAVFAFLVGVYLCSCLVDVLRRVAFKGLQRVSCKKASEV